MTQRETYIRYQCVGDPESARIPGQCARLFEATQLELRGPPRVLRRKAAAHMVFNQEVEMALQFRRQVGFDRTGPAPLRQPSQKSSQRVHHACPCPGLLRAGSTRNRPTRAATRDHFDSSAASWRAPREVRL